MSDNVSSSRNIKIAACLVTVLFFLWGLSYGLIDVMNKNFQNQLGITKATSGLLQAAYFGGYLNENFIQLANALQLSNAELEHMAANSFLAKFY